MIYCLPDSAPNWGRPSKYMRSHFTRRPTVGTLFWSRAKAENRLMWRYLLLMEDYVWGSLSPTNHLAEIIVVNSNTGKISHVPLIIISGFVSLVYKLYPWAFSRKKKKKNLLFLIHSFQAEFQAYITKKRWNPILIQTHKRLGKMLAFPVPPERLPWRSLRR